MEVQLELENFDIRFGRHRSQFLELDPSGGLIPVVGQNMQALQKLDLPAPPVMVDDGPHALQHGGDAVAGLVAEAAHCVDILAQRHRVDLKNHLDVGSVDFDVVPQQRRGIEGRPAFVFFTPSWLK